MFLQEPYIEGKGGLRMSDVAHHLLLIHTCLRIHAHEFSHRGDRNL